MYTYTHFKRTKLHLIDFKLLKVFVYSLKSLQILFSYGLIVQFIFTRLVKLKSKLQSRESTLCLFGVFFQSYCSI